MAFNLDVYFKLILNLWREYINIYLYSIRFLYKIVFIGHMKTIIIFDTKHGSTETVANIIAEKIKTRGEDVDIYNIDKTEVPNINDYNRIIIGGSIHAGNIQKSIKTFCEENKDTIMSKSLGLYICCMQKEQSAEQFKNAFDITLREHSISNGIMGGEFLFEKMNFIERFFVKKIAKVKESISKLDYESINKFVENLFKDYIV